MLPILLLFSHLTPNISHLTPNISHLTPNISHLTPNISHLPRNISHISLLTPNMSSLTPSISHLKLHISHLTFNISHISHLPLIPLPLTLSTLLQMSSRHARISISLRLIISSLRISSASRACPRACDWRNSASRLVICFSSRPVSVLWRWWADARFNCSCCRFCSSRLI
jgi:hypothetical protein